MAYPLLSLLADGVLIGNGEVTGWSMSLTTEIVKVCLLALFEEVKGFAPGNVELQLKPFFLLFLSLGKSKSKKKSKRKRI